MCRVLQATVPARLFWSNLTIARLPFVLRDEVLALSLRPVSDSAYLPMDLRRRNADVHQRAGSPVEHFFSKDTAASEMYTLSTRRSSDLAVPGRRGAARPA